MTCWKHKTCTAVAYCITCGRELCNLCTREVGGVIYCADHQPGATPASGGQSGTSAGSTGVTMFKTIDPEKKWRRSDVFFWIVVATTIAAILTYGLRAWIIYASNDETQKVARAAAQKKSPKPPEPEERGQRLPGNGSQSPPAPVPESKTLPPAPVPGAPAPATPPPAPVPGAPDIRQTQPTPASVPPIVARPATGIANFKDRVCADSINSEYDYSEDSPSSISVELREGCSSGLITVPSSWLFWSTQSASDNEDGWLGITFVPAAMPMVINTLSIPYPRSERKIRLQGRGRIVLVKAQ